MPLRLRTKLASILPVIALAGWFHRVGAAELGNGGPVTSCDMFEFRKAQEKGTKRIKNALFIKTTDFARPAEFSHCPTHGHHWYANADSYFLIGEAAGDRMKTLLK